MPDTRISLDITVPDIAALHFGTDVILLSTRTQVLRLAGFMVVPVSGLAEAKELRRAGDFDLVLMCHSVPAELRRSMVDFVRLHRPSVPVVLIAPAYESEDSVDAIINTEPDKLIIALPEILNASRSRPGTA